MMGESKIDAADIFDWDYLCKIAESMETSEVKTLADAVRFFAYAFTSTGRMEEQNRLLASWILNATYLQSRKTADEILAALATEAHGDLDLLREFASQIGIKTKR